jgi:uncharacterized repeat protein (TIGR01451 family)
MRKSLGLLGGTALLVGALALLMAGRAFAQPRSEVVMTPVTATFFAAPFATGPVLLDFPVIDFNPPPGAVSCSNETGVTASTRPLTDVVPYPDGSCTILPADDGYHAAGVGDLFAFNAIFTTSLMVAAPGSLRFTVYAGDPWTLGFGLPTASPARGLPTRLSGPLSGTFGETADKRYPAVAANDTASGLLLGTDFQLSFPAAGIYPLELDYRECCGDPLSFALAADGAAIPPAHADLSVTKTDSRDPVALGSSLTYTLVAHNAGPDDAMGVIVTDKLPAGMMFESVSPPNVCNYYPGMSRSADSISIYGTRYHGPPEHAVVCDFGVLPTGADVTANISVVAEKEGTAVNTASVRTFETVGSSLSYSGVHDLNPANDRAAEETSVEAPPDCSRVSATPGVLWPPNHKLRKVVLSGTDSGGRPLAITITGVTYDEHGNGGGRHRGTSATAPGPTPDSVLLRAERSGGRVYTISFTGSGAHGGSCSGTARVAVPHDGRNGRT